MSNYAKRKEAEALLKKENNKKTAISVVIFIAAVILLVAGFWYGKHLREYKNGDPNYDVFDYVTLGDYEGLEVYYVIPEVSEEELQVEIDAILKEGIEYAEITREVKEGDRVTIDFKGTVDGKEFEGGSDEDYVYVLGEGTMIDGFDEGIYGMKTGEERTIKVTFPEDYSEELAGKDAEFAITLKKSEEVSFVPEWNDTFVTKHTEGEYKTTSDYEKVLREELLAYATSTSDSQFENDIWEAIRENATIEGYPEYVYNTVSTSVKANVESTASMYGMTTEDYLTFFAGGVTMEEYILEYVNSRLLTEALVKTLDLELPQDKYEEYAEAELAYYNVDSLEALEELYGEDTLKEYYLEVYLNEKLVEMSVKKEVTQAEYNELTSEVEGE